MVTRPVGRVASRRVARSPSRARFEVLLESFGDEDGKSNSGVDVTFDWFGIHGDLSPRHCLVRACTGVASIELLRGVDEHGVIRAVSHQITVANVVLGDAAAENNDARLPRPFNLDRLIVHRSNVRDDVNDQAWVLIRVKVQHVADGTIRQRRTIARNIVLRSPIKDGILVVNLHTKPLDHR